MSRAYEVDSLTTNQLQFESVNLHDPEFESVEYKELIRTVQSNDKLLPDISISDGFVYKKVDFSSGNPLDDDHSWKLWIPDKLTEKLIMMAHNPPSCSHGGVAKTLNRLKCWYYWPNMAVQVKAYVDACAICKGAKAVNSFSRPPMGKHIIVERPFQFIYIDLLGPYPRSKDGNTTLLVILDKLTKFMFAHPLRKATSQSIINLMKTELFPIFGTPEIIYTDNGPQFKCKNFTSFLKMNGCEALNTPRYCPQSNAAERINRSLLAAIRSYLKSDQREWDKYIHEIIASS